MAGSATISTAGAFTVTRYCPDVKNCLTVLPTPVINLSVNAGGASTWPTPPTTGRLAPSPTVSSRSASLGVWTNPSLVSVNAPSLSDFTTNAVDATAGSWMRVSNIDGHSETLFANNPHAGMTFRA